MADEVYLDHNATTPCAPEVIEAMLPYFSLEYGNSSSIHQMGGRALTACAAAREQVAELIGCAHDEIFFTSGATESNNIVLLGVMGSVSARKKVVITTVEHKSIGEPCKSLARRGIEIVQIPVKSNCVVDVDAAIALIDEQTALVSVQGANNEVGVIQPVREIAEIAHTHGALFHCDAAQLLGKAPVSSDELSFDYASFSGHKIYGPKGVGMLFVRKGTARGSIQPVFHGGGQENSLRPGTLNVPGIVGVGEACRIAMRELTVDIQRISTLRQLFEETLRRDMPNVRFNGFEADRIPGTSNVTIPGVPAGMLIANLPHFAIGEGSACNSGAPTPSHVLLAMGITREEAECTLRISLGRGNSIKDVEQAAASIAAAAKQLLSELSIVSATIGTAQGKHP